MYADNGGRLGNPTVISRPKHPPEDRRPSRRSLSSAQKHEQRTRRAVFFEVLDDGNRERQDNVIFGKEGDALYDI